MAQRPAGAGELPPGFVAYSTSELAWNYVRRVRRDMLPEQYHDQTIYFRREPRVPMRLLGDTQLILLRELSVQPGTLLGSGQRTGADREDLLHPLACLYYAGSITTTASKVAHSGGTQSAEGARIPGLDGAVSRLREDLTAPAVLKSHKGY
jgi:hypothetical protein